MNYIDVSWRDANNGSHTTRVTATDNTADPSFPIVLLLHGAGGNIFHMVAPDSSPGMQYNVDFVPDFVIDRGWLPVGSS